MLNQLAYLPAVLCITCLAVSACDPAPENASTQPVSETTSDPAPQDTSRYQYKTYPFPIGDNFIAMSPLPGKEDLEKDVEQLVDQNITAVVSLVSAEELREKGLPNFFEVFHAHGIEVYHSPIVDFGLPRKTQMDSILTFLQSKLDSNQNVLVHCMGGYGRSGTVMGSYANAYLQVEDPISFVRKTRGKYAIETKEQEAFVKGYGKESPRSGN